MGRRQRATVEQRYREKTREQAIYELDGAIEKMRAMEQVMACLLDHYLNCYDMNRDALAREAEQMLPQWPQLAAKWEPKSR
jgi:hypothetical protein